VSDLTGTSSRSRSTPGPGRLRPRERRGLPARRLREPRTPRRPVPERRRQRRCDRGWAPGDGPVRGAAVGRGRPADARCHRLAALDGPGDGSRAELAQDVLLSDLALACGGTAPTFKLDALVAATAERVPGQPVGRDYRLKDVQAVADELANELPRTEEAAASSRCSRRRRRWSAEDHGPPRAGGSRDESPLSAGVRGGAAPADACPPDGGAGTAPGGWTTRSAVADLERLALVRSCGTASTRGASSPSAGDAWASPAESSRGVPRGCRASRCRPARRTRTTIARMWE
jgi:hypothetical protein